jgi:hypothetical protein
MSRVIAALLGLFFVVVVGCEVTVDPLSATTTPTISAVRAISAPDARFDHRLQTPPPHAPSAGDPIKRLNSRRLVWEDATFEDAEAGDEIRFRNLLYRVTRDGLDYVDVAPDEALLHADAAWDASAEHTYPEGQDVVYVLGGPPEGGHVRLRHVEAGQQFAFQGRVFEVGVFGSRMTMKLTGDVIAAVTNTFRRHAPEVIDAVLEYDDGTEDVLTGTPNHPFWVPAAQDYVPLGELEVGAVLHVQGGGEAILVSKTWRQGDFEVFDFEVEGLHNFYVRGEGSGAAGVLVHNSTPKGAIHVTPNGTALPPGINVDLVPTASGKKGDYMQIHQSHEHKGMGAESGIGAHTHQPVTHTSPDGVERSQRTASPTTAADIDAADAAVKNGTLRQRTSRRDPGDL